MSNMQHVFSSSIEVQGEWESKNLGELAEFINGRAFKPVDWQETGVPIIRIQNLNGSNEFNYYQGEVEERHKIHNNDLLFSWSGSRGTSFGPHIWKGPNGALNQHIFKIKINKEESLDKYYFYYALKRITQLIEKDAHGSAGLVHITKKNLEGFSIPVPSLREQQKIALIISSVDETIEKTKFIIKQTEKVKKGLMQRLLKKGIGHERYKDTTIGSIPEDWDLRAFKDVCEIVSGQVNPKVEPFASMLHIGSNNIEKFTGRILDCKTAKEEGVTSGKYLFTQEHVLFSKIRPELSKVAFPKAQGICSADIYPIKAKNGCMIPEFIKYVLLSKRFYEYSVSVSGRTGIPKVNRGELEIFQILVPSIDEQRKIVSILSEVERKAANEQKRLREFQNIKKGLMQSLLTSKVRVKVEGTEVKQV